MRSKFIYFKYVTVKSSDLINNFLQLYNQKYIYHSATVRISVTMPNTLNFKEIVVSRIWITSCPR